MFSSIKKIYNKYSFLIFSSSTIYINIFAQSIYFKYFANILFISYLCSNFCKYFNIFFEYKIYLTNSIIDYFYGKEFYLCNCYLYSDLNRKYEVTYLLKNFSIKLINRDLIDEIYDYLNIKFVNNENIRLKFIYYYEGKKYISYFPYYKINIFTGQSMLLNKDYYLPYPFFNNLIMENYRKNIIYPSYSKKFSEEQISNKFTQNNNLYNLFNMESKNIRALTINNKFNIKLEDYFKLIKTPFNDYGILYNCPIRLIWILVENNISISDFKNFYIKFWEHIFNEENMSLKEHFINLDNLNSIIISEHMKEILSK